MAELGPLLVAVVLWVAVAWKAATLRRTPSNPALRAHVLTLACLAGAVTLFVPAVYTWVDRVTGVPNLAELLGHLLVVASAWQAQVMLVLLAADPARVRRPILFSGLFAFAAGIVLVVCFVLAPVDVDSPGTFTERYANAPYVAWYWAMLIGYLAVSLGFVAVTSWRYADRATRRPLRQGLRMVAVGSGLGVAYFAHWGLYVLARRTDHDLPAVVDTASKVLFAAAVLLVVDGSTWPAVQRRMDDRSPAEWLASYRDCRRLLQLWRALVVATPEIALTLPRPALADALTFTDVPFRLYRRVIEIRDGRLALRPHLPADVQVVARQVGQRNGLRAVDLDAFEEAASLAVGLRAKAAGRHYKDRSSEPPRGGAQLEDEVEWLVRVADQFASSPAIPEVVARMDTYA